MTATANQPYQREKNVTTQQISQILSNDCALWYRVVATTFRVLAIALFKILTCRMVDDMHFFIKLWFHLKNFL